MRDLRGGSGAGGECTVEGAGRRDGQPGVAGDSHGGRCGGAIGIGGSGSAGSGDLWSGGAGIDYGKSGTAAESGVHITGFGNCGSVAVAGDGIGGGLVQGGAGTELRGRTVSYREDRAGEFCGDGVLLRGD